LGKRPHPLRVVARAHITPKAAVALVEVPGKLLVVGVSGSTLVPLGEVATEAAVQPQPAPETAPPTFAAALEQHVQALEPPVACSVPLAEEPEPQAPPSEPEDHAFVQWSAQIQRKLSQLKQL
jgi:hypothetical protein